MMKDRCERKLGRIGTWKVVELRKARKKETEKETEMRWFGGVRQQVS